ncbi:hypothetical protein Hypma_012569 [Hypsizygus marmoreus]|uniref:DUF6697 domain-containing protein n=1 Tax=Hypsizygus marmoreus TaxID=39966 RepID=A0A369JKN1_HYPMA|nr:hypothetical protein Hypma_012569 [Hypsizygus marmoreus]
MPALNSRSAIATLAVTRQSNIKDEFDPNDMPLTVFNKPEDLQNPKSSSLSDVKVCSAKKEDTQKSEEKLDSKSGTNDAKGLGLPLKANEFEDDTKLQKSDDSKPHFGELECRPPVTPPPTYEFVVDTRHIPDYNDGGEDYELDPLTPLPSSPVNEGYELSMTMKDHLAEMTNPRQAKRRKVFMEAVEVPTLQSIFGDRVGPQIGRAFEEDEEEIKVMLENLKNPNVKKSEGRVLTLDTVRERLRKDGLGLYPIPLDKSVQDVEVTRLFLSKHYGGGMVETFPTIGKKFLHLHDLRDFMYPNLDYNPHCPEVPGAPGLFFAADGHHADPWPEIQRVISRIRSGWWLYQGQYRMKPAKSLTKEEWASQKQKFRNTWAKQIYKKDWGKTIRARIFLRERLRRECTEAELNKALDNERGYHETTPDKILRAFARGEEFIAVWTMKCVGYDTEFQLNLANKFPTWVPPPPKAKADKGTKKPRSEGRPRNSQATAGQKRKRAAVDLSDEESDSDSSDGEDSQDSEPEEVEEVAYRTRGTRSRPIIL